MKPIRLKSLLRPLALAACLLAGGPARGSTYAFNFSSLNATVPDGSSAGVGVTRQLSLPALPIAKVSLSFAVLPRDGQPMFNGDLYAGLTHGSDYAVLLNRAGRRTGSSLGYGDSGFDLRFDDDASNGDVHVYRLELNGSHTIGLQPAGTPLTGVWAPDGRTVSPASVLASDARPALLEQFAGMDANGDWTLFVADWETGGLAKLDRWSLEITLIPEPLPPGSLTGLGLLALAMLRRRQAQLRWRGAPGKTHGIESFHRVHER